MFSLAVRWEITGNMISDLSRVQCAGMHTAVPPPTSVSPVQRSACPPVARQIETEHKATPITLRPRLHEDACG